MSDLLLNPAPVLTEDQARGVRLGLLLAGLVGGILFLLNTVAWHRYILRDEQPAFILQKHPEEALWYFLRGFGYALLVIPLTFVAGLIFLAVLFIFMEVLSPEIVSAFEGNSLFRFGGNLAVGAFFSYFMLRLATALPTPALGERVDFLAGWRATRKDHVTFIVLAVVLWLIQILTEQVPYWLFGASPAPLLIWAAVVGWVSWIYGLSLMSTLYGHYIEGRPLR